MLHNMNIEFDFNDELGYIEFIELHFPVDKVLEIISAINLESSIKITRSFVKDRE